MNISPALSRALALMLLLVVLAALYLGAARPLWHRYQTNLEELADLRDHLARYAGLEASIDELAREVETLERSDVTTVYTLAEQSENLAAAALQERIKGIVSTSGAELTSTQVLPGVRNEPFVRVSVNVRLSATAEALQRVLHLVESEPPYLIVDNLAVRARNVRSNDNTRSVERPMQIQMRLSGFIRERQG